MTARFAVSFSAPMLIALLIFFARRTTIHYNLPPYAFWLFWLGLLAFLILMLYAKGRSLKKRREALAQLAIENGFEFSETSDSAIQAELAQIKIGPGQFDTNPRFRNVLKGNRARCEVVVCDRTVGSGKSQSTSTVLAFKLAEPLPTFVLCNENALWRLADKLGYKDIDVESSPEFSNRFFLHAQDEAAVRTVFTPDVVCAFQQLPADWNFQASSAGFWLAFSRPGSLISPEHIQLILSQAETVVGSFQSHRSGVFNS